MNSSIPPSSKSASSALRAILPTSTNTSPVLHLSRVSRTFQEADRQLVILNEIDLELWPGQICALVAPSGAGKSTLLQIAGLLEKPDAGEISINGVALASASDAERTAVRRSELGFVYQFHHLLPEFTALENVAMPQLINGLSQKAADERALQLLAYMKVDHRADHRPGELSGGEQQRVAIARAVANAPKLLLADEPTGNLDATTADHVYKALETLVRNSGLSALIATHNLFLAERMDRQITIVDGKVVQL